MSRFLLRSLGLTALRNASIPTISPDQNDWELSEEKQISALGNPVFSNLIFDAKTYVVGDETIEFPGLRVDSVLMTVNQTKNIVKTPVQGRNGTVKEYVSDGDFSISVAGTIHSPEPFVYPREAVANLLKVLSIPDAISITSEFLNYFNISSVVVDSYQLEQQRGARNFQIFTLSLTSDEPLEIQIREEQVIKQQQLTPVFITVQNVEGSGNIVSIEQ